MNKLSIRSGRIRRPESCDTSRRGFVSGVAAAGIVAALGYVPRGRAQAPELSGTAFELEIGPGAVNVTGRPAVGALVNGSLPAPLLRWREGDTVSVRVSNALADDTSIHWHGILLPANMDGVPGLSFRGIAPGDSYLYRFQVRQNGTYWYHSHSGFQEQVGLYGPLVIDAAQPEPFEYDREHVVMLSDWTDRDPLDLYRLLKKHSDYFNYIKPTLGDFAEAVQSQGIKSALAERAAWARMRMSPSDLADVNGHTYTYLMNGTSSGGNWTGLFRPGERLRLRFINGSAMSFFDVRIPGLKLTVVAADGQYVHPVTVDEFRIGAAETYDVLVQPGGADAFTIFAQSVDRSGYVRGTLATRTGAAAPVPEMAKVVMLSMADMGHGGMRGMDHGAMDATVASGGQDAVDHAAMGHAPETVDHAAMGHESGAMADSAPGSEAMMAMLRHPASERRNPGVDMQTMQPSARLADPGVGLRDNGRRVLTYADLHSLFDDPDGREPGREIELHLTGHMQRYLWSFNGLRFSEAEPLALKYGERMRITLVNDTMMEHPIHLHGLWSDLEDEQGGFQVRKHTVNMPPGTRRSYRVSADALGRWAYHCHLLYHMEAGMFREVRVDE